MLETLSKVNYLEIAPISLPERRDHEIRGIYFLFLEEELVYIGQSINIPARLNFHRTNKEFTTCRILVTPEDLNMEDIEKKFIKMYNPLYNKTYSNKKPRRQKRSFSLLNFSLFSINNITEEI